MKIKGDYNRQLHVMVHGNIMHSDLEFLSLPNGASDENTRVFSRFSLQRVSWASEDSTNGTLYYSMILNDAERRMSQP